MQQSDDMESAGRRVRRAEARRVPDGDLERALAGDVRLVGRDVLREAWAGVDGQKWNAFVVVHVVMGVGLVAGVLVYGALYKLFPMTASFGTLEWIWEFSALFMSATVQTVLALSMAPVTGWTYLAIWNASLRGVTGRRVGVRDLFPTRAVLPGVAVALLCALVGLVTLVHGVLFFIAYAALLLCWWAYPLLLDRDVGVEQALRWSVQLTRHNWAQLLGILVIVGLTNVAAIMVCGVGLIWWLPFALNVLGVSYRQLCGVRPGG